jgi:hypothetical protein
MKKTNGIKRILAGVFLSLLFLVSLSFATDAPKQRVEREFRQLEVAVTRFMTNTVPQASSVESMDRMIYDFMRENPGVVRILRTNAAGITVNDMSAGSMHSAPPRNISAQRWLQYIIQHKTPYYSIDYDAAGELTLFYAWPLMAGSDKSRFSGAFAAVIDFTAHAALIDNSAPFQIAYSGKAFFQHEWEDVDFDEEPLEIRGAKHLTIRTERPVPTRLDPRQPARRSLSAEQEIIPGEDDILSEDLQDSVAGIDNKEKKKGASARIFKILDLNTFILLTIIAILLIFIFTRSGFGKFARDDQPPPQKITRVVVKTANDQPLPEDHPLAKPPQPLSLNDNPPPQPLLKDNPPPKTVNYNVNQPKVETGNDYVDQQIGKLFEAVKQEFNSMNKKINTLAQKVNDLERMG